LRATAASAGNDHRLGANEAPPAIISIFMGSALSDLLDQLEKGEAISYKNNTNFKIGADTLPELPKDNTDRNRTSPFAFTGNKFEFRMLGSSFSISGTNVALMTILAEAFDEIATRLENSSNPKEEIIKILKDYYSKHKRIVFNGNNYSEEWVKETEKRGLPNFRNCVDALKAYDMPKAQDLFTKYNVFTKEELKSRYEIYMEQYCKAINIEGRSAVEMAKTQYIPAVIEYCAFLAESIGKIKSVGVSVKVQEALLKEINSYLESAQEKVVKIERALKMARDFDDLVKEAVVYRDDAATGILELRKDIDKLETLLPKTFWPVPTYTEMLFMSANL